MYNLIYSSLKQGSFKYHMPDLSPTFQTGDSEIPCSAFWTQRGFVLLRTRNNGWSFGHQENASDYPFTKREVLLWVNDFRWFIPWLLTPLMLGLWWHTEAQEELTVECVRSSPGRRQRERDRKLLIISYYPLQGHDPNDLASFHHEPSL